MFESQTNRKQYQTANNQKKNKRVWKTYELNSCKDPNEGALAI